MRLLDETGLLALEHLMNPVEVFVAFVSNRARKAGYAAFQAGFPRQAPMEFGEYSGAWVEGWNAAALIRSALLLTRVQ